VPKFQRDYSWEQEQWQDLWEDIEFIHKRADEYHCRVPELTHASSCNSIKAVDLSSLLEIIPSRN
jgi:hypothetical protein